MRVRDENQSFLRASSAAVLLIRLLTEAALKFAKERILYGKPIARLQAIQFMLADMDMEIEVAKWLGYHARAPRQDANSALFNLLFKDLLILC